MAEQPYVRNAKQGTLAHRFAAGYRDGWALSPRNKRDGTKNYGYGYEAGKRDREQGIIREYMWGTTDPNSQRYRRLDAEVG